MKKLRSTQGFTLTEMLLTVLIMSLVTAAVAAGVVTARDVYNKIRLTADAQTLASTAIHAISEDLESGYDFEQDSSGNLIFTSENRGYRMYFANNGQNGIQIYSVNNHTVVPMLTDKTESLGLYTEIEIPAAGHSFTENSPYVWFTLTVRDAEHREREKDTVCVRLLAEDSLGGSTD